MIGMGTKICDRRIWLSREPLDMRLGFDTLAEQVRTILQGDPLSGHLFVFRSRGGGRLKILWWDANGYAIYYKRLERGHFVFPPITGASVTIDARQLRQLLEGCVIQWSHGTADRRSSAADRS